jgi:hypothetical protein
MVSETFIHMYKYPSTSTHTPKQDFLPPFLKSPMVIAHTFVAVVAVENSNFPIPR